jgi:hypothetical protein
VGLVVIIQVGLVLEELLHSCAVNRHV